MLWKYRGRHRTVLNILITENNSEATVEKIGSYLVMHKVFVTKLAEFKKNQEQKWDDKKELLQKFFFFAIIKRMLFKT